MGALYTVGGALIGSALTALTMGFDGRIGMLFLPAAFAIVAASIWEWHSK